MQIGDLVAVFSHVGFLRYSQIVEKGLPSEINELTCYKIADGSRFYMKPELGTNRYFNVGNRAFWIKKVDEKLALYNG